MAARFAVEIRRPSIMHQQPEWGEAIGREVCEANKCAETPAKQDERPYEIAERGLKGIQKLRSSEFKTGEHTVTLSYEACINYRECKTHAASCSLRSVWFWTTSSSAYNISVRCVM